MEVRQIKVTLAAIDGTNLIEQNARLAQILRTGVVQPCARQEMRSHRVRALLAK